MSDSGVIEEQLPTYPIGTFVEIKCNDGFAVDGENLISCTDQGSWDFEIEECKPEQKDEKKPPVKALPLEFLRNFKEFLFFSCQTENRETPLLCGKYKSNNDSDLSAFELPETKEFEGMDAKLSKLLENLLNSEKLSFINAETFLTILLSNQGNDLFRDSYRFVICLYIDLIIIDGDLISNDNIITDNINEHIKGMLKKITLQIYINDEA